MRFIPDTLNFKYGQIKTVSSTVAKWVDSVCLEGVFDIFCDGSRIRAELMLNEDEVAQLNAVINSVAARYDKMIKHQVISEVKRSIE